MPTTFDKKPTTIFGRNNEKKFFKYISSRYKTTHKNLSKDGDDFEEIDFLDDVRRRCYEFKSRNIKHNKYKTAILNQCKIDCYMKDYKNYKFYVYFLYSDGLFRTEITKDLIKTFKPYKLYSYQEQNKCGYKWVVDIPESKMVYLRSLESFNLQYT